MVNHFLFVGLFIIIGGFEANGGIKYLADQLIVLTHGSLNAATMIILWASGILSGITSSLIVKALFISLFLRFKLLNSNSPLNFIILLYILKF